ncbi:BgTH12-04269 [Blumeria graminis f. sp. triticale]|uniref:BgtA-21335 n=3 Tax=Blumeria graminis TaxID=34373 RepID=A0A9X9LAQ0_BLUGR|nr:hypothetical protein BGT96224_A21335 [Blumeria graminis f. sp. tritici 96224]CAD6500166.1 BgTH12-04269 [Blumeria graminis f. sp. triticale]VCU40408.1 BgtA-21335 [Blumeria graminis f. sp. tritici]
MALISPKTKVFPMSTSCEQPRVNNLHRTSGNFDDPAALSEPIHDLPLALARDDQKLGRQEYSAQDLRTRRVRSLVATNQAQLATQRQKRANSSVTASLPWENMPGPHPDFGFSSSRTSSTSSTSSRMTSSRHGSTASYNSRSSIDSTKSMSSSTKSKTSNRSMKSFSSTYAFW